MKFSTKIAAFNSVSTVERIQRIISFAENHKENQAEIAVNEFKKSFKYTLLIVFFIVVPMIVIGTHFMMKVSDVRTYPNGATQEILGRISLYKKTFWYTANTQKYEFDFGDYNIDDSFQPGENIFIYLDANNKIVSVAHETHEEVRNVQIGILLMISAIILILIFAFYGRKTFAKNWLRYVLWYEKEIEPYIYNENFEEIVADKKYYDVICKKSRKNSRVE